MRVSSTGATPSHLEQGGAPSSCSPVVAARNVRGVGGLVSLAWGASMQSMPAMRRCACSRAGARLARIWAHFSASRLRAAARRASRYAVHAFAPGGGGRLAAARERVHAFGPDVRARLVLLTRQTARRRRSPSVRPRTRYARRVDRTLPHRTWSASSGRCREGRLSDRRRPR